MKYQKWVDEVPEEIKNNAIWNLKVYQAALFLSDLCWDDVQEIIEKRFFSLSDQLYRSIESVSANVAEGYSRNSYKEKARFYEIALGSARESKDWYFKSRHILGRKKAMNRIKLITSIIKLLLIMINEKKDSARASEQKADYFI
jgi:four helix bundle protein